MVDAQHTPAELDRAARVRLAAHIVTYANMLEVQKQSWADEAHVTKTKTMLAELTLLATLCGEGNQLLFFDIFDGHVRCSLTTAPLELCEQLAIFVPGVGTTVASSLP